MRTSRRALLVAGVLGLATPVGPRVLAGQGRAAPLGKALHPAELWGIGYASSHAAPLIPAASVGILDAPASWHPEFV